jgi:hypothetical protein
MTRITAVCLLAGVSFLPLACGDSSGPGDGSGVTGTVQVFAKDNPNSMNAALVGGPSFDRQSGANAASYDGSLSGEMSVAIQTQAGAWIDVGSPRSITMTAHSTDSTDVSGSATMPAGTYTKVRIIWRHAAAHLLAGSVIGGLTLSVDAVVDIGGPDSVVIEKTMTPFTVQASASATTKTDIVFDLNSEVWLTEQNVQSRACSESSVDAAVTAAVRATGE